LLARGPALMADEGDAPLPGFEGVEKNLEIDFVPGGE
jgi:hypothetical protein